MQSNQDLVLYMHQDHVTKTVLRIIGFLRGNVHTQIATLSVRLTFVGVWVKMPDVRFVAEMSKTIVSGTKQKKYLILHKYRQIVSFHFMLKAEVIHSLIIFTVYPSSECLANILTTT